MKTVTFVNYTHQSEQLTLDNLYEDLDPLVEAGHKSGVTVFVTPRQWTNLMCDEAALRRAGFSKIDPLSKTFSFETGIGTVKVRKLYTAQQAVLEGLLS